MEVLRIEDETGNGPFRGTDCRGADIHDRFVPYQERSQRMPTPWEDGITFAPGIHHCGFASIEQMEMWFSSPLGREEMRLAGFKLYSYSVSEHDVNQGEFQVVFVRPPVETRRLVQ